MKVIKWRWRAGQIENFVAISLQPFGVSLAIWAPAKENWRILTIGRPQLW